MSERLVKADTKAIDQLGHDLVTMRRELLRNLYNRGYDLLKDEVPVQFGNLKQGVAQESIDYEAMRAELTVSARSGATSGVAEVFGKDGKPVKKADGSNKTVTLRPQPGYNYADVIARGNKEATLSPKQAKAFLIPVPTAPDGEGYLMIGGKYFVLRKSRKGQKANPFDERAAVRLEGEATAIGNAVLERFV